VPLPAYRLVNGDTGPRQQSNVTCGSACLTVARMLVDPAFAHWVATGKGALPGSPGGGSPQERFAAYERVVHRRTNTFTLARGGLNLPWPRRLGTPPWGAKNELELGAAKQGTAYGITVLRSLPQARLVEVFDRLNAVVSDGTPALLYVGSETLPRHVLLILPGNGDDRLDVYDPADGSVRARGVRSFATHDLGLSGWDVPWFVVAPAGPRAVRARARRARYAPIPDADVSPA
jgi:hypothetical protein